MDTILAVAKKAAKDSGGALQSEAVAMERDFGSYQAFDMNFQSLASTQEATRILETEQAESGSASSRLSSRHVRRHLRYSTRSDEHRREPGSLTGRLEHGEGTHAIRAHGAIFPFGWYGKKPLRRPREL